MKSFAYAVCAFFCLVVGAKAEEPRLPPVLSPLAPADTLPADGTFETLGVGLGMTWDEALAALEKVGGKVPKTTIETTGLGDNRGNEFMFVYRKSASVRFVDTDDSNQEIEVLFTTNINESRVESVSRSISFSGKNQGDFVGFLDSMIKKYGEISYMEKYGLNIVKFYWIWHDGEKKKFDKKIFDEREFNENFPVSCINASVQGYYFGVLKSLPRCNAVIRVDVTLGNRDDLISQVTFEFMDNSRWNRNVSDTDAWARAELQRVISAKGGTTPKL